MALFNTVGKTEKYKSYDTKTLVPQYIPNTDTKTPIEALVNTEKYSKLIYAINKSNSTEAEKKFLRLAAARHIVFNYNYIADYYATASPELQELMEHSALVILDMDDAIANGYVTLSKDIRKILEQSGEIAGD